MTKQEFLEQLQRHQAEKEANTNTTLPGIVTQKQVRPVDGGCVHLIPVPLPLSVMSKTVMFRSGR